jgi:hypothetical protein
MSVVPFTAQSEREGFREWIALMTPAAELAKVVANTDFVPRAMRGNPAAIAAAILYGDEVGLGPMQSLAKIAVIDGRPTLAAETQRGLILAAGHEIWTEEATVSRVTVAGRRRESDVTERRTWTLDDARRAGLAARQNWKSYPRQMLHARASAELARAHFADVIGGLAATEELEGEEVAVDSGGSSTATETTKPARRSRARAASAVVSSAPPAEEGRAHPPLPGEEEPAPPSEAQTKKLHALMAEKGLTKRDDRLEWSSVIVGRRIESSVELSGEEVSKLIDELEKLPPAPEPKEGEDA